VRLRPGGLSDSAGEVKCSFQARVSDGIVKERWYMWLTTMDLHTDM